MLTGSLRVCASMWHLQRQSLWSLDMYSECNTGNANSGINDDPAMGQHGMQDCAFEIDDGAYFSCFSRTAQPVLSEQSSTLRADLLG